MKSTFWKPRHLLALSALTSPRSRNDVGVLVSKGMFSLAVSLRSLMMSPVSDSIQGIFTLGTINKIVQSVVRWISIEMPSLHPFWQRPDESQQDELMDLARAGEALLGETDAEIPLGSSGLRFEHPTGVRSPTLIDPRQASYSSQRGYFIQSLKAWDRPPCLWHGFQPTR